MMNVDAFLSTVILLVDTLNYPDTPKVLRARYNVVLGFMPMRRKTVSAARQIVEAGLVNGFEAAVGDYHVRPLNAKKMFTDDLGWIVARDVFKTTYEWLPGEPGQGSDFSQCRKSVPTYAYDTTRLDPWEGAVIVSTPEADMPLYYGDWLAIGGNGEMWPIPVKDHVNFEALEGVR